MFFPTIRAERLVLDGFVVDGLWSTPHVPLALCAPPVLGREQVPSVPAETTVLRHLRLQVFPVRRQDLRHTCTEKVHQINLLVKEYPTLALRPYQMVTSRQSQHVEREGSGTGEGNV